MRSIAEINYKDLAGLRKEGYHPSPIAWEDQVLYFLMTDRFSTGTETEAYSPADNGNAVQTDADSNAWRDAGIKFCGGTIKGIISKLDYIQNLGITAVWVSPIFKQVAKLETYHGYGIQNFLEIDPRFGTKEDLLELTKKAHERGIYVILDIILNHSGNVFEYNPDRYWDAEKKLNDSRWDGRTYATKGFYDKDRNITQQIVDIEDGIWPVEFQDLEGIFTRKGHISNWDYDPEYKEGDFFDLKDLDLGKDDLNSLKSTKALKALCEVYKYWIAFADIDGYRIDTVKHMGRSATRHFCCDIKEFTQRINKQNFYLIGEVTGGRINAFDTVELTGLSAALGIDDVQDKLEYIAKGGRNPEDYFNLFGNSKELGKDSHVWLNDKVVTMIDDHDQVRKGDNKARFCATQDGDKLIYCALALNLMTLGIPCIYYGTEQRFDGQGTSDRYIRECMFGGKFGAFRSKQKHCFDNKNDLYVKINTLIRFRKSRIELTRGRQYLRQISGNGIGFSYPQMIGGKLESIVAWSRILNSTELICAINNSTTQTLTTWVTIEDDLHAVGEQFACIFSDNAAGVHCSAVEARNGKAVQITLPPASFAVFEKQG